MPTASVPLDLVRPTPAIVQKAVEARDAHLAYDVNDQLGAIGSAVEAAFAALRDLVSGDLIEPDPPSLTVTNTAPNAMLTMGLGRVLAAHSSHDGMPCIILTPVSKPGTVGRDGSDAMSVDDFTPESICIRFATPASTIDMLDRLKMMIEAFQKAHRSPLEIADR